VLIHGAPKIVLRALDPDEHLVQVPFVPRLWPSAAKTVGKTLPGLLAPAPNSLVGDHNAPLSQEQLDVAQAEAEHMVQPDSMADDLSGEAMAAVRVGWWFHAASLAGLHPTARCGYRDNSYRHI